MDDFVKSIIDRINNPEVNDLNSLVKFADMMYRKGDPIISDYQYDVLLKMFEKEYPSDPFLHKVVDIGDFLNISDSNKIDNKYSNVYSIDSFFGQPSLEEFLVQVRVERAEEELKSLENFQVSTTSEAISLEEDTNLHKEIQIDNNIDKLLALYPMRSIKAIFNQDDLTKWINLVSGYEINYSFKLDGYSWRAVYVNSKLVRATTRSRSGGLGLDITRHLKLLLPNNINLPGLVEVRGELILPFDNFSILKERYQNKSFSNPRNSIASLIREDASDEDILLVKPFAYSMITEKGHLNKLSDTFITLEDNKFNVIPYFVHKFEEKTIDKQIEEVFSILNAFGEKKDSLGYLTDGVVASVDDLFIIDELGGDDKYLDGVKALKIGPWASHSYISVIQDIEWSYGSKFITPVAIIEPVVTDSNRVVSRVNLGSVSRMIELNAFPGNMLEFEYVSDMNPKAI